MAGFQEYSHNMTLQTNQKLTLSDAAVLQAQFVERISNENANPFNKPTQGKRA